MFQDETYIHRRKALKEKFDSGLIFLPGNPESPMNYPDNPYRFRQDSSFLYYFGVNFPGVSAVIDIDLDEEMIFADEPTMADIVFLGPQAPLSETALKAGVRKTGPLSDMADRLAEAAAQDRKVHYLPQYRAENLIKLHELLKIPVTGINDHVSVELIKAVVAQRSIKSGEEIAEIERSLDISYEMHTAAMKASKPGVYEYEVAGLIEGTALSMNGRISFPVIFTVHGETLHNPYHGNKMQSRDLVINDSGAETAMNYCSDITRTIPVGGKFTSKQKDIYNIVLKAQATCIEACRPGIEFRDVHLLAGKILSEGLKGLGLIKGDPDEAAREGAHTLFFQCGLGHQMGLDVHDMEGLGEDYVGYTDSIQRDPRFGFRSLRMGKALEAGHVMTVEPGVYFIPELINRWKAEKKLKQFINYDKVEEYRDFGGIRLEDNVLITEDGCRLLGKKIPKSIEEVERLASM